MPAGPSRAWKSLFHSLNLAHTGLYARKLAHRSPLLRSHPRFYLIARLPSMLSMSVWDVVVAAEFRRVKFFTSNRWFDTSRARQELGFVPRVPLREGLIRTLASYRRLGWV